MQAKKMKTITIILTLLILISCSRNKKSVDSHTKIDLELVDHVYIKKELYGTDSVRLSQEQTELFVQKWNSAKSKGLYKMGPQYWLNIKLKNDSVRRFKTNRDLIKENNDWTYSLADTTLINSFWESQTYGFLNPEQFDPISFIKVLSKTLKTQSDTIRIGITMIDKFPKDWVKEEHIEPLFLILESKEVGGCFINPLSSYLPFDDYSEKGGFAAIFIKAFKENKKVELGLHSCPKVDEKLNTELRKWWKEKK